MRHVLFCLPNLVFFKNRLAIFNIYSKGTTITQICKKYENEVFSLTKKSLFITFTDTKVKRTENRISETF